jgi:hypothetical protein
MKESIKILLAVVLSCVGTLAVVNVLDEQKEVEGVEGVEGVE